MTKNFGTFALSLIFCSESGLILKLTGSGFAFIKPGKFA